jgi:hypothetical protein
MTPTCASVNGSVLAPGGARGPPALRPAPLPRAIALDLRTRTPTADLTPRFGDAGGAVLGRPPRDDRLDVLRSCCDRARRIAAARSREQTATARALSQQRGNVASSRTRGRVMSRYSGLVVSGLVAAVVGGGCAAESGDDAQRVTGAPVPSVGVVLDGVRYAPDEVADAVAGRTLHYVAIAGDGSDLYAFDDGGEALAFARAAGARESVAISGIGLPPIPSPPPPPVPPPPPAAKFYEHDGYNGCMFATASDLSRVSTSSICGGGGNDMVSSVDTNGRIVTVYADDNFQGASLTLAGRYGSLNPYGWNDRISSIDVWQ